MIKCVQCNDKMKGKAVFCHISFPNKKPTQNFLCSEKCLFHYGKKLGGLDALKEFNNIKDLKLVLKILNDCSANRKIPDFQCEKCRCFELLSCCVKDERMTTIRFTEWLIQFINEINSRKYKELLSEKDVKRVNGCRGA